MWQVYCLALASAKSSTTTTNHQPSVAPPTSIRSRPAALHSRILHSFRPTSSTLTYSLAPTCSSLLAALPKASRTTFAPIGSFVKLACPAPFAHSVIWSYPYTRLRLPA
ncbi:predicted protein [Histoplasma capsulatum var. duboisii H88]|uniref:Predicted protein n=1 Tax=Ajellomyces capsulatus (strain H88) TaxID=544711 RepID=F0UDI4_AJEC8|nr:predicted protein [Histoplasma capsulatum var. duboisii H88]